MHAYMHVCKHYYHVHVCMHACMYVCTYARSVRNNHSFKASPLLLSLIIYFKFKTHSFMIYLLRYGSPLSDH